MALDVLRVGPNEYHVLDDSESHDLLVLPGGDGQRLVHRDGRSAPVMLLDDRQAARAALGARSGNSVHAGRVVEGDNVQAGEALVLVDQGQR